MNTTPKFKEKTVICLIKKRNKNLSIIDKFIKRKYLFFTRNKCL